MSRQAPIAPGCLYLVGTPIGNLEDMSPRALRVLAEVDLIAAEDTRTARPFLAHFSIQKRTVSLHRDNESARALGLLELLREGKSVALISEAGMPGLSDPGEVLVRRCVEQGLPFDVVPGPSAVLTALLLSGLPTIPFTFHGFVPRKGRARRELFEALRWQRGTQVLFEAPTRTADTLALLHEVLGDRPAALVREMTKHFQEVLRLPLGALEQHAAQNPPRGEVTLVLGGAPFEAMSDEDLRLEVSQKLEQGQGPRQVAEALAAHGKRRVYQLALELRRP